MFNLVLAVISIFSVESISAQCTASTPACPGFVTYTQGGWGATASGNNPGAKLAAGFTSVFPAGITIGCTNKIVLTSATAVKNFLPQGSTARTLNAGTLTNPTKTSYSNVLAGQLVAATISVGFDAAQASFAPSSANLKDLKVSTGPMFDYTVSEVLAEANKFIGGCGNSFTAAQLNTVLDNINKAYDNGVSSGNFLVCPITLSSSVTNVSCFGGNNGSIALSNIVSGAGAPFTYTWSNGATTQNISNLVAGNYSVIVRDKIGITKKITFTVSEPTKLVASTSNDPILCFGGTTNIVVSALGGTTPYSGTGTFNVKAGSYSYIVTDTHGCTSTVAPVVTEPTELTINTSTGTILCYGGSTTVTVNGNGGTAPYSGTGTFTVTAGTYSYTVTDANGCSKTTSVTVTEPTQLVLNSTAGSILCHGGTTQVDIIAHGGTAPYSGNGQFTVLAGTNNYIVTDANGCSENINVSVSEPELLVADFKADVILCHGGTANVEITAIGGTEPYSGTGTFNVTAGTYTYTVTDANGCTSTISVTVSEPELLVADFKADVILCNGGTANVDIMASGGTEPYTGTGTFTVSAGTYTYTVIDANGCSSDVTVTVTEPSALVLSGSTMNDHSCNGGACTGSAAVVTTGGTAPYNFNWSNGSTLADSITGLCYNSAVSVIITDANGCTASYAFDSIHCVQTTCDPLVTYTQGGWGAVPKGNNPGTILVNYFSSVFPNGITIGSASRKLVLTSAKAVENFLPSGGSPAVLALGTLINSSAYKNTFAGQLVAATINVTIDATIPSFAAPTHKLGDMFCNFAPFKGMTVNQLLAAANTAIGGGASNFSISDLNNALTKLNQFYDNGIQASASTYDSSEDDDEDGEEDADFLCAPKVKKHHEGGDDRLAGTAESISMYPNPASDLINFNIPAQKSGMAMIKIYSLTGQVLMTKSVSVATGMNNITLDLPTQLVNGMVLVEVGTDSYNVKKQLVIRK